MTQTCAGRFEIKEKMTKSQYVGTIRNLKRLDLNLPCQTDVEPVQNELWATFRRTSSVDCDAYWRIAKSRSLSCLGRVLNVDRAY